MVRKQEAALNNPLRPVVLRDCFHVSGRGRHPRNPLGLFRTFIVMRMKMKAVRSLREMTRLLDTDQRLRKLCLIRKGESGYLRSAVSYTHLTLPTNREV